MLEFFSIIKSDINDLVNLFNTVFKYDNITKELLREKIFEEKSFLPEANFKVIQDGELCGFSVGFVRNQGGIITGWIKLLACEDQSTLGAITLEVFHRIEDILIQNGAKLIRFFDSFPNYYFPGIDPRYTALITLVETNGYKRQRDNVNMTVNLNKAPLETSSIEKLLLEKHNIVVRRATEEEYNSVLKFIEKEFSLWITEVSNSYKRIPIAVHIALQNDEVIAFSGYHGNNIGMGWFGPMGTTPACRGKGIGGILLKRCLEDLREQGFYEAIIPWVGPIGFYFKEVGAEVSRTFWNYRKEISTDTKIAT